MSREALLDTGTEDLVRISIEDKSYKINDSQNCSTINIPAVSLRRAYRYIPAKSEI